MRAQIIENLQERFAAYGDLIAAVTDNTLTAQLDVPKHKSLAEHLWCVVGARESYAKALAGGEWQGFACSMSGFAYTDFLASLEQSAELVLQEIDAVNDWTTERDRLLATLAEHEVMHEGQIIRHIYGIGGTLPDSWKWS